MDFEDDPSASAGKSDLKSKQRYKSLKGKMVEAMGSLVLKRACPRIKKYLPHV